LLSAVLEATDVDNGPVTQTLTHSDAGRIAASAERAAFMALFLVVNRVLVIRAAAATLFMIALFFWSRPF
jgi:hypothetical protein